MITFSDWLYQKMTGWVALVFMVLFILFTAFVLPAQNQQAESYSDESGSPDTSFYYTAEKLVQFAEQYGAEGRAAYIKARLTFDVIFPLVYGAFLTTAITWTFHMITPQGSPWRRLNLVPLLGVLFDYLENAAVALVMARYPQSTPFIPHLAGYTTAIKWLFVGTSFLLLVIGVVLAKGNMIQSHKKPRT